ncbi:iron-sulfur cluster co-chaperone protein HscB [Aplochiton taeniatus]
MFWLKNVRIIFLSHGIQHSNKLLTTRSYLTKLPPYATFSKSSVTIRSKCKWSHSNSNWIQNERIVENGTNVSSSRTFCTSYLKLNCWNCQHPIKETPSFFCSSCKLVQPPDEEASYFQIMDCDLTYTLDSHTLQKRYLQLQRFLHPDNFGQKTAKEQKYAEHQSALVNKAYKTLLKPLSRGLYMLELNGMRLEEGTDLGADPEFLMELMEINEALDEARNSEEANEIGQSTQSIVYPFQKIQDLTKQIDSALHKGELIAAKELLAQMKYFANIEEKVKAKLSDFM